EKLMENAAATGSYLLEALKKIPGLQKVRGKGLMIGFDVPGGASDLRQSLLHRHKIFTGAAGSETIRLLPPLSVSREEVDILLRALRQELIENTPVNPILT